MKTTRVSATVAGLALSLALGASASAQFFGEWQNPVNLESILGTSSELNTEFNDGCPHLSSDGLDLYLASNRPGGIGGIDIWRASRNSVDEPFGTPVNLPAPLNSEADDFCPTSLGNGLLFVSSRAGGFGGTDIYHSWQAGDGEWAEPFNLGSGANSPSDEASPSLVEETDGPYLYFSSNRPDGFEQGGTDSDIYSSRIMDEFLRTAPAELVSGLNTASDDSRPSVRRGFANGLEIVFDSNRPGGLGGFDLWTASRTTSGDDWQSPTNVMALNSAANETRASLSGDALTLVFGSNRPGSEGQADVYVATRATVPEPTSAVLFCVAGLSLICIRSRVRP